MKNNLKHWDTALITQLGNWLYNKGEYGHALLCLHAPHWGFKIGKQLTIKWSDVLIYTEDNKYLRTKQILLLKGSEPRCLTDFNLSIVYDFLKINSIDEYLYVNSKTNKQLTTSTLNRELHKFSEEFLKEKNLTRNLKPLKSNSFEIAWAIDNINYYHRSIEIFRLVSSHLGHRTVKDTIDLLELEPIQIKKVKSNLYRIN